MATPTYTLIDSEVLASAAASVTFASIPADYRDLVLVITGTSSGAFNRLVSMQLNSDTGNNYSQVSMSGNGSDVTSSSGTSDDLTVGALGTTSPAMGITQIMDYSATDKHKSLLIRQDNAGLFTLARAGRWANTSAVETIYLFPNADNFAAGSTFYLYGIEA
jgi:hypothetical protein